MGACLLHRQWAARAATLAAAGPVPSRLGRARPPRDLLIRLRHITDMVPVAPIYVRIEAPDGAPDEAGLAVERTKLYTKAPERFLAARPEE